MQQPTSPVYKTLTWLLLLVVIGLYALHLWHSGQLKDHVATHKAALVETGQRLTEAKAGLDRAAQTEQGLRGDIEQLKGAHQAEVQGLSGRIDSATQTMQGLKAEMEAQRAQANEALAAEQRKANEAMAAEQGLILTPRHWVVIEYLRDYYKEFGHPPSPKLVIRAIGDEISPHVACTRRTLEGLFPAGGCKQACHIAGLPDYFCHSC